jgi:replicative DNA helicase
MVTDELKQEVIYSDNPGRLFEIMIELNEQIASLHIDLVKTEEYVKKTELKGEISMRNVLLTIIDKRIDKVRSFDTEKDRKELFSSRQFRQAAKLVLQKETYERIKELSEVSYINFKDQRFELKSKKLE